MSSRHVPAGEWLAVALPPTFAMVFVITAAVDADSEEHGWIAFGTGLLAGLAPVLIYTAALVREHRLFLRDTAAIERNRTRIGQLAILGGWLLGVVLLIVALAVSGVSRIVVFSVLGGALLGFWPGLLANFIRLRRER